MLKQGKEVSPADLQWKLLNTDYYNIFDCAEIGLVEPLTEILEMGGRIDRSM
jgi:hypothetical protein